MSSKYIKKYTIPVGFQELLSEFTKEILRNQPQDIIDFGIEYFRCLQERIVLDYQKRGNNLPCDFKPSIPKIPDNVKIMAVERPESSHSKQSKKSNKQVTEQKQEGEKEENAQNTQENMVNEEEQVTHIKKEVITTTVKTQEINEGGKTVVKTEKEEKK